jgi:hypothetical protein
MPFANMRAFHTGTNMGLARRAMFNQSIKESNLGRPNYNQPICWGTSVTYI